MALPKAGYIMAIVIGLFVAGILIPIGLSDMTGYDGNFTYANGTVGNNSTIGTLIGTVMPIMVGVALIMGFLSRKLTN